MNTTYKVVHQCPLFPRGVAQAASGPNADSLGLPAITFQIIRFQMVQVGVRMDDS